MSRHPFSKNWKAPVVFLILAVLAFGVFLATHSYFAAITTLLVAGVAFGIYVTGESSDLPGTAGKRNKNVRT